MSKLSQGAKRNKRKVDDRNRRRNMTDKEWAVAKKVKRQTKKQLKNQKRGRKGHNVKIKIKTNE